MLKSALFMFCFVALMGCGGGGAAERVMVQPSDRIESAAGFDTQIQPILETDPKLSALKQSKLGNNVMLWIGGKTAEVVARFPALIQEAKKYPNITSVYLYDELFWTGTEVQIGLHETEVLWGAKMVHDAGLKTVIVLNPQVILSPDFAMKNINAFDMIGIDFYPSMGFVNTPGCSFDSNPYSTILFCSALKLRKAGYLGKLGYLYQAFAVKGVSAEETLRQLIMQRATIYKAVEMGIDSIMPWGMYLGTTELQNEPFLIPLGGTKYEYLIRPPE